MLNKRRLEPPVYPSLHLGEDDGVKWWPLNVIIVVVLICCKLFSMA